MSGNCIEVSPRSRKEIRALCESLRKALELDDEPYFPIMEVVELAVPHFVENYEFQVCTFDELGENHGLTYPARGLLMIREDVYERACAGHGRDRLTVAHELGHLVLHQHVPFARPQPGRGKIPAYRDSEWQANCFGGELLMSARLSDGISDVARLARTFGVSEQAAGYQRAQYQKDGLIR